MSVGDHTSRPLYRQVAEELKVRIERQELTPGGQLPTEASLMDTYGVSRNTVRLALGLLRSEGLVVTGQGRGSFVADAPVATVTHRAGRLRHEVHGPDHAIEFDEGGAAERIDVTVAITAASTTIAEALRIPAGAQVLERRRLLYRDRRPSSAADSYLPEDVAGDRALRHAGPLAGGVAAILEQDGLAITRHTDDVTVRMPSPAEAQHLQIATGVPVLALLRTAYDRTDAAVCATLSILPGDRHGLRYAVAVDRLEETSR